MEGILINVSPLVEVLGKIPDNRGKRGKRYSLVSILSLACLAMMCGYKSNAAIAEWGINYRDYTKMLGFKRRTPCAATIHNVFSEIDQNILETELGKWAEEIMQKMAEKNPDTPGINAITIDGKTLKGALKQRAELPHLLSAIGQVLGITITQHAVASALDEQTGIIEVLKNLSLNGRIVTADALHTHRNIAQIVIEKEGDYILPVKANQPQLLEDIQTVFAENDNFPTAQTTDCAHGRLEQRTIRTSTVLNGYCNWPGLSQVFSITRSRTEKKTGESSLEVVYGITSLSPARAPADILLQLVRQHWHIENKSHWVRDVTFDEDRSQIRSGSTPQIMAAIRNTIISLFRISGIENIASGCRNFAANPLNAIKLLGLKS